MNAWCAAALEPCCGNYYSPEPCRAQSADPRHKYCEAHQKLAAANQKLADRKTRTRSRSKTKEKNHGA